MIKRYASHFIFLPGHGYLKQYVVGVEEGQVVSAFPLTEEIEGVEWFPGVIALLIFPKGTPVYFRKQMKYYRNFRKFSAKKRFLPE